MKIGAIYQHYKNGKHYKLLAIGRHTETEEELAVYQEVEALQRTWIRELSVFQENVDWEGKRVLRFKEVA